MCLYCCLPGLLFGVFLGSCHFFHLGCHLVLSSVLSSRVFIWVVILECHFGLSSDVVIWYLCLDCHLVLLSGVVVRAVTCCSHMVLPSDFFICCCHLVMTFGVFI
jgi:hypothetical protein